MVTFDHQRVARSSRATTVPVQSRPRISSPVVQRAPACACGGGCPRCQAKSDGLKVSQPHDSAEIEADRLTETVMRMSERDFSPVNAAPMSSVAVLWRKCAECEETAERSKITDHGSYSLSGSSPVGAVLASGGKSLSAETRAYFEPRFGYDFSRVRVFSDTKAAQSAQDLHAQAYTYGQNIVFNHNKYQPDTFSGRKLLAHELAHVVQQQTGKVGRMIQKADDASFESAAGVDQGIANGTMTQDSSIMGQTYTVNCGFRSYNFSFKFSKAYKGVYPYQAAGRDVRGVYVKIEASIADRRYCGRCTPMRLLQVIRYFQKGSRGNMETTEPTSATRRERAGWSNTSAPSRGWFVDTLDTATNPYYTHNSPFDSEEGDETRPARLWDAPGHWTSVINHGKEFYTCAVCEDASHRRWVAACVQWGYYTDSSGNINFRPSTPAASCGYVQEMRDASERWDTIAGNTPTGITF